MTVFDFTLLHEIIKKKATTRHVDELMNVAHYRLDDPILGATLMDSSKGEERRIRQG